MLFVRKAGGVGLQFFGDVVIEQAKRSCAFLKVRPSRNADTLIAKHRSGQRYHARYEAVEDLLARHQAGTEDATDRIWRLLNLQIWGDLFLTGRKVRWFDGVIEKGRPKVAVG